MQTQYHVAENPLPNQDAPCLQAMTDTLLRQCFPLVSLGTTRDKALAGREDVLELSLSKLLSRRRRNRRQALKA